MRFEYKDGEDVLFVSYLNGEAQFGSDLLDKTYKSLPALEAAVKAKRLELRKNFSNPQAFLVDRWDQRIQPVTVTSLDDEAHAWVKKANGQRSKERRTSLYADEKALQSTIDADAALKQQIKDLWSKLTFWEPKP